MGDLEQKVTACVTSLYTSDGMYEMASHVKLGDQYILYPRKLQVRKETHQVTGEIINVGWIWAKNEDGEGWLPLEYFDFQSKSKLLKYLQIL